MHDPDTDYMLRIRTKQLYKLLMYAFTDLSPPKKKDQFMASDKLKYIKLKERSKTSNRYIMHAYIQH